jgi:hypothetical protein
MYPRRQAGSGRHHERDVAEPQARPSQCGPWSTRPVGPCRADTSSADADKPRRGDPVYVPASTGWEEPPGLRDRLSTTRGNSAPATKKRKAATTGQPRPAEQLEPAEPAGSQAKIERPRCGRCPASREATSCEVVSFDFDKVKLRGKTSHPRGCAASPHYETCLATRWLRRTSFCGEWRRSREGGWLHPSTLKETLGLFEGLIDGDATADASRRPPYKFGGRTRTHQTVLSPPTCPRKTKSPPGARAAAATEVSGGQHGAFGGRPGREPRPKRKRRPRQHRSSDVTTGYAVSAWTLVGAPGSMPRGTWARRRGRATPRRPSVTPRRQARARRRHVSSTAEPRPCHLSVDPGRVTQVRAAWNMGSATWSSHAAETQCLPTSTGLGEPPGT